MNEDLTTLLETWRKDPVRFTIDLFGEKPDPIQAEVMRAVAEHPQVAVKSGHGVGKTWLSARLALWYFITHPYSKVITTAPTMNQVKTILWPEIHAAVRKLPEAIKPSLELLDTTLYMRGPDGSRLKEWYIIGRASDKPENVQGFHAPYIMLIVDEASGMPREVFEAFQGAQTTNSKVLLVGNPTKAEGVFYDAFHKHRDLWKTFTISCIDSPRVSREWIEARKREWGEDSVVYRVRVLGEFPDVVSDALIPLHWIEAAAARDLPIHPGDPGVKVRVGVDVARTGEDETVITVVGLKGDAAKVLEIVAAQGKPTTWTAAKAAELADRYNAEIINVDDTGVGGGVTDILKARGYRVGRIVFGARPTSEEAKMTFANLKAQIYHELREWFDPERPGVIAIPDHSKLIRDLSGLKVDYTAVDKLKIVDPPKSPDYADSLVIAITRVSTAKGTARPPSRFRRRR